MLFKGFGLCFKTVEDKAPAVLILDLNPHAPDMAEAFCKQRTLVTNTSLFYMCYCVDQMELTWIQSMVTDTVAKTYDDGTILGACLPQKHQRRLVAAIAAGSKVELARLGRRWR